MMNDEKFELTICDLAGSGTYYADIADELRARDTVQREAIEAWKAAQAREAAALAQAWEQRDTDQAQLAEAVGLLREIETAKIIFNAEKFELNRRLVAFLARRAKAAQQEAQNAQDGDEREAFEEWAKDRSWFDPRPSTKERDDSLFFYEDAITDHNWIAWQARAALATQPATIKLPDRKRYNGLGSSAENLASAAWNQCLDAAQKLNAVRGAEHE